MSDTRATTTDPSTPASPSPATTPAPSSPTIDDEDARRARFKAEHEARTAAWVAGAAILLTDSLTLTELDDANEAAGRPFEGLAGKLVAEMGPPETPESPAAALNGTEDYAHDGAPLPPSRLRIVQAERDERPSYLHEVPKAAILAGAEKAFEQDAAFTARLVGGDTKIVPRPVTLVHVAAPTLQTNVDGNPILQFHGRDGERFYLVISDYRIAYDLSERLSEAATARGLQSPAKIAALYEKEWENTHEGVVFAHDAAEHGSAYVDGTRVSENCEVFAWLAAPALGMVVLFLSWGATPVPGIRTRAFVIDTSAARSLSVKLLRSAHDAIAKAQGGALPTLDDAEPPAAADPNYVPPPFASAIAQAPELLANYKEEIASAAAAAKAVDEAYAESIAASTAPPPPTPDGAA